MAGEQGFNQVLFDDVRVPVAGRLGAENDGWTVAKHLLTFERGGRYAPSLAAHLASIRAAAEQTGWLAHDGNRERLAREASAALGVPVALQRLDVAWWPLPAVALEGVSLQTRPAVTLARIEARPAWRARWSRR